MIAERLLRPHLGRSDEQELARRRDRRARSNTTPSFRAAGGTFGREDIPGLDWGRMPSHDTLNFFDPNKDIPAHHENQLTRAFLVVLRISPAAHQVWLSLAAPDRKLYELPRPWNFDTQRWQMFEQAPEVVEPLEGISVLQSADPETVGGSVQITQRSQVLDGIVRYGDELLIVIEAKLEGRAPARQAQYLNVHGAQVRFDGSVQTVSWRELLAAWYDLVESAVVTGAERTIIVDFLDFVERHFSRLGPYTTLGHCKDNEFRVSRRLNAVLDEIAGGPTKGWLELPGRSTVDRAFLEFDKLSQLIQLKIYPGDSLTQAKAFYTRPKAISKVLLLRADNWKVEPNFHFAFMARGYVWTKADAPVEEYVDYWTERINGTGAVPRTEWGRFWKELVSQRFARADEKSEFDLYFTKTRRKMATPRPGLSCFYCWELSEAKVLDDNNQFVGAVAHQLEIVLRALGETPHKSPKSDKRSK